MDLAASRILSYANGSASGCDWAAISRVNNAPPAINRSPRERTTEATPGRARFQGNGIGSGASSSRRTESITELMNPGDGMTRKSALTLRPSSQKLSVVEKDSSMPHSTFSQASQNTIDFIHPIGFQFGFHFPGGDEIHHVNQVSGVVLCRSENRSLFE